MGGRRRRDGREAAATVTGTMPSSGDPRVGDPASTGGGSIMNAPMVLEQGFIRESTPALEMGFYGKAHLTRKTRPMSPDTIQVRVDTWDWNVLGYWTSNTASTVFPVEYNGAQKIIEAWYPYTRTILNQSQHYAMKVLALNLPAIMTDFFNVYHYAGSNLVTLLNANKLSLFNAGLAELVASIPDSMVRITRLYRRWRAVPMVPKITEVTVRDGMIPYIPGQYAPHIRVWIPDTLVGYSGAADYTAYANPKDVFTTGLSAHLDNIEKALGFLEGNGITYDANAQADITAARDLIDRLMTDRDASVASLWQQGMAPMEDGYPGLSIDKSLLNDWYMRGLHFPDTHGALADANMYFPIPGRTELNGQIPIMGFGQPTPDDENLFGMIKYYQVADSIAGVWYGDPAAGLKVLSFGTSIRGVKSNSYFIVRESVYTREDGWTYLTSIATDWGDGLAIRTWWNEPHMELLHTYFPLVFGSQLTASQEFRLMENSAMCRDYIHWYDHNEFTQNYSTEISRALGVPYIT